MKNRVWTFETLAQANRATLEQVLLNSKAADPAQLVGSVYDGYNHDWLGQLPGKKFQKTFRVQDTQFYGWNRLVQQDQMGFTGEWRTRVENAKPVEMGFFRILPAAKIAANGQVERYKHLTCFDYSIALNPKRSRLVRAIRDYVGAPNEGDCDLLLGKAYLRVTPFLYIFASYFILGHRQPDERS